MIRRLPLSRTEEDVTTVRAALGPVNPVAPEGSAAPAPPGWSLAAIDSSEPAARRAVTITAMATVAALAAAIVAIVVVGSGGDRRNAVSSNPQAVLTAYDATVAAGSAHAHLTVKSASTVVDVSGTGDLATGDADLTVSLPAPLGSLRVLNAAGSSYVGLPMAFSAMAGGKPWVKIDRAALGQLAGSGLAGLSLDNGIDFQSVLTWLRGAGTVKSLGDGRYQVDIDLIQAAAKAPAAQQEKLRALAEAAHQSIPVDVTLDAAGRLTHLDASIDLDKIQLPPNATRPELATGVTTVTLDLTNFAQPFRVDPPRPEDVTDAGGILSLWKGTTH